MTRVCSPVRRYWCATAENWPAGLPIPGGSATAGPSAADCAAEAAYIPRWIHPRSRDRKLPCQPARRTCQPRGNLCSIYKWRSMSESVAEKMHTRNGCREIRNKFARYAVRYILAVISRAKNADTSRTRNRNESPMRYRRMFQRESALILKKN